MKPLRVALVLLSALGCATTHRPVHHGLAFPNFPATGGGLSTVTTSTPVSGDGSVGTPVTIANGAIANAKLAFPLPSGTGVVKVTSGTAAVASKNVDYTSPNWYSRQIAVIQAIDPTITETAWATECESVTMAIAVGGATATGNFAVLTTEDSGVCQASTGATSGSTRVATNIGGIGLVSNCKTHHWAMAARAKIVTTPDANTGMKILDMAGATTADHILGVQGTTTTGGSNANWSLWVNGSGNTFATVTTALTIGTYVDLIEVFDGAVLHGLVNGVEIGTISDLTNFDTSAGHPRAFAQNGSTAANQAFNIDKWAVFTTPAQ